MTFVDGHHQEAVSFFRALISPLRSIYTLSILFRLSVKAVRLIPCIISSSQTSALFMFSGIKRPFSNNNILFPSTSSLMRLLRKINQAKNRCKRTITKQLIITGTNADAPTIARLNTAPSDMLIYYRAEYAFQKTAFPIS